jgi:outer membrane protein OmpA-like peptidoglycan-associated protein
MTTWKNGVVRGATVAALASALSGTACEPQGSNGSGCKYDGWQGRCALVGVRTARIIERFPKSYVVIEATYEPQSTPGQFAPPPFRKELITPAEYEQAYSDQLRQSPNVECAVLEATQDPCGPKMSARVPEFVVPATPQVAQGPVGCAKLEHADPTPSPVSLPGPFQFEQNSASDDDAIRRLADDVAERIRADQRIECVAIKAKTAPGEPFTLANDRAQLVKRLLESRGIDRTRLTVFEATAPTYTVAPAEEQPPLAEQRRVFLTVVVYGQK